MLLLVVVPHPFFLLMPLPERVFVLPFVSVPPAACFIRSLLVLLLMRFLHRDFQHTLAEMYTCVIYD
jgi:hypothetical protein